MSQRHPVLSHPLTLAVIGTLLSAFTSICSYWILNDQRVGRELAVLTEQVSANRKRLEDHERRLEVLARLNVAIERLAVATENVRLLVERVDEKHEDDMRELRSRDRR